MCIMSPMTRALQTAYISLGWLMEQGVPAIPQAEWQENTVNNIDIGRPVAELEKEFPHKGRTLRVLANSLTERGVAARKWLHELKEKVIAVISHDGFMRVGICQRKFGNADYRVFDFEENGLGFVEWKSTEEKGGGLGTSPQGHFGWLLNDLKYMPKNTAMIMETSCEKGHEFRMRDGVPEDVNEFFRSMVRTRPVVKYKDLPGWILQYEIKNAKERREKEEEDMRRKIQAEKDTNRAWLVAEMRKRIALKKEEEKVNEEMKQKVDSSHGPGPGGRDEHPKSCETLVTLYTLYRLTFHIAGALIISNDAKAKKSTYHLPASNSATRGSVLSSCGRDCEYSSTVTPLSSLYIDSSGITVLFCLFHLLEKYIPKPATNAITATTPTTIPPIAPPDICEEELDVGELVDVGEVVGVGELVDVGEVVDVGELVDVGEVIDVALTLGGVVELEDV
ncbi:phosphoglycerate mutase protein [Rutstroemia sp. NJR-2017a BVV2]|nr:phosphoglycerate mutase protein [Rutstroemia sp. NJR-2017a BVV2]PQE25207.1 phosphoglycerate mutase protein [Rutstroemia sp. NJR-2017a BVV2]